MNPRPLNPMPPRRTRRRPRTAVSAALALAATLTSAAALVSCSTDSDGASSESSRTVSKRPTAPDSSSFSEKTASPLKSRASEAAESAHASASKAEASASQRADEFEASVSADTERANQAAKGALKDVAGQGNAMSDVSMTGKPRSDTGGVLASVVTFTNSTDKKASYAVQVDFRDSSGKTVETRYVGTEDLEPGKRAQRYAISHEPPEPKLSARLVKAQRY
ncbi:hypothetical protein ACGFSB_06115 [Streptomyces sp. NPDC048441]|uniref:hypothetical protein n=1 Tax=Streptomyces sp. NPDC048441 TaxID=3365552 RepID=UPI00370F8EC1